MESHCLLRSDLNFIGYSVPVAACSCYTFNVDQVR
jgi:hypothetical protein